MADESVSSSVQKGVVQSSSGFLLAAWLLTVVALLGSIWTAFDSYREYATTTQHVFQVQDLRGSIVHLDEVLTMSARMAVATGDPDWERRYREFEGKLDDAIQDAVALIPEAESTQQTDAANAALIAMENQTFELVRRGDSGAARDILFGDEYARQKAIYAEGMQKLGDRLDASADTAIQEQRSRTLSQLVGVSAVIAVLIIGWVVALLSARTGVVKVTTTGMSKRGPIIAALVLLILVGTGARIVLDQIETRTREQAGESLETILEGTLESVQAWFEREREYGERLVRHPDVLTLTEQLLAGPSDRESLLESEAFAGLREYFGNAMETHGEIGVFVISPELVNLFSMRDTNVGDRNLIDTHRPEVLARAFSGETVFVPPIPSDVPLPDENGVLIQSPPTMFVAVPMESGSGEVMAVATLRFDPTKEFSRLLQVGRMGESAETYAFDESGMLLSESRFRDSIIAAGMVDPRESTILSLRIADPGGDLVKGHNPSLQLEEQPLTRMAQAAVAGRSGVDVAGYRDYRGAQVLGAWLWDPQFRIGITTEIDELEALEVFRTSRAIVIAFVGLAMLLGLSLTAFVLWSGERTRATLGAARDEWERIAGQRTRELEKSERELHELIEAAPFALLVSHGDGLDAKTEHVNERLTKMLGYTVDDLPGMAAWVDLVFPPQRARDAHLADLERARAGIGSGLLAAVERTILHRSGSQRECEVAATVFGDRTLYMVNDITARKEAEKQILEARDQAQAATRAKSVFLANMSHELRTPMNAIIGYSEMLTEDAEDDGNEEAAGDLRKIHNAGTHLLSLINDVLDLSKIEAGKMTLYLEKFEVGSLVDGVVSTIDPLIKKNGNRLNVSIDPTLGEMRADVTKVRQAIFNLLSNAAKFTHEGEIGLNLQGENSDGEDWIRMSVSDSGIGIPPEKIDRVFEEFSQADDSTTRNYGGTGLGLPISRRFCQMMGGDITVSSVVGEGSTFTIRLPLIVQDESETTEVSTESTTIVPSGSEKGPVVLVVDDDPNALDLLSRTLQGSGLEVVTAGDGPQALELARSLRPAAITLDVLMPGMDGWEVLGELKADPETRDIPVIMVTMTDDREVGYALGATEFLTKPINRGELVKLLNRYAPKAATRRALMVEDLPQDRDLMRRALEQENWQVVEAENGRVGLDRLTEGEFSLILLDLMMPLMDGFEFLMEVRKVDEWRRIPILVVTAKELTEEDRQRLNGDVVALIEKRGTDRESLLAQLIEHVSAASESSTLP